MKAHILTLSISVYLRRECIAGSVMLAGFLVAVCFPEYAHAYDGSKYGVICKRVLETVEGKFGALLTAAAGLGAIIASAAGGFKVAWSLLVVAIGSFTLRTYQEIWFAPCGG